MSVKFDPNEERCRKAIWQAARFAVAEGKSRLEFMASMVVDHGPDTAKQAKKAYEAQAQRHNQAVRRSEQR
jgi:hypothetical protein